MADLRGDRTEDHAADHRHEPPALGALRVRGRRLTRQRAAIWRVLTDIPDQHLSADEVSERVRVLVPDVNASTVYRTLDVLVEDGLVRRSHLGEHRAYFEPAHEHPHHHVVCERCGSVAHVHDDVLGDFATRLRAAEGFVLGSAEITFTGLCAACATGPPNDPSERSTA